MAAGDKLYFSNVKEIITFYKWCEMFDDMCVKETQKSILDYWYPIDHIINYKNLPNKYPTVNLPFCLRNWLWRHCPLQFVRNEMVYWWDFDKPHKNTLFYIDRAFDRDEFRKQRALKKLLEVSKQYWVPRKERKITYAVYNKIKAGDNPHKHIKRLSKIWYGHLISPDV